MINKKKKISDYLELKILKVLKYKKFANIIVCGGKSPRILYHELSKKNIPWERVNFFLSDERLDSNSLNAEIIKSFLLKKYAIKANFFSIYNNNFDLKKINKLYIKNNFDFAILGVGIDGHFASIFPKLKYIKKILNNNLPPKLYLTERSGKPLVERITMNLSLILKSKEIILIFRKKNIFTFFQEKQRKVKAINFPINYLINSKKENLHFANERFFMRKVA